MASKGEEKHGGGLGSGKCVACSRSGAQRSPAGGQGLHGEKSPEGRPGAGTACHRGRHCVSDGRTCARGLAPEAQCAAAFPQPSPVNPKPRQEATLLAIIATQSALS